MVKNVLKILASIIMMTAVATMTVQAATDGNLTCRCFEQYAEGTYAHLLYQFFHSGFQLRDVDGHVKYFHDQ